MRVSRRSPSAGRTGRVPAQSRVTVRRTVAALRRGRVAIEGIEQQLDALLDALSADAPANEPTSQPPIASDAVDRLGEAVRDAAAALAVLDLGSRSR